MILSDGGKRRKQEAHTCQGILGSLDTARRGLRGFLKEKAAPREAAIRKAYEGIGGKVEAVYWGAGGEYSGAVVVELPDAATGAAFGMVVGASGAFDAVTLMEVVTSSELDRALAKTITYRPPGG
jgi:uncharacterized protein with GYD domain